MTLFELWFSWGICPAVRLLGRMVRTRSLEWFLHRFYNNSEPWKKLMCPWQTLKVLWPALTPSFLLPGTLPPQKPRRLTSMAQGSSAGGWSGDTVPAKVARNLLGAGDSVRVLILYWKGQKALSIDISWYQHSLTKTQGSGRGGPQEGGPVPTPVQAATTSTVLIFKAL